MQDSPIGKIILIVSLSTLVLVLFFSNFGENSQVKVYDCGMAEWHPDIPPQVKEECRRLRFEEQKRHFEQYNNRNNLTTT